MIINNGHTLYIVASKSQNEVFGQYTSSNTNTDPLLDYHLKKGVINMSNSISFNETDIVVDIDGMGIVFCSESVAASFEDKYDVFRNEFSTPEQVAKHVMKGDITGFCTGSSGTYILHFRAGYPVDSIKETYFTMARLGIEICGDYLNIYDLFDLMEWEKNCSFERKIRIDNGFYHITLCTCRPDTGIIGNNQDIYVYLNKLNSMPVLKYKGVPQLIPPSN